MQNFGFTSIVSSIFIGTYAYRLFSLDICRRSPVACLFLSSVVKMTHLKLLSFMVLVALGYGATLNGPDSYRNEDEALDVGDDSARRSGKALETLGRILQEGATKPHSDDVDAAVAALEVVSGEKNQRREDSEYFLKKIKKALGTVAKAVVVHKIAGTIG